MAPVQVLIPYSRGDLVAKFHQHGHVEAEEHVDDGTYLSGRLPIEMAGMYSEFWTDNEVAISAD
jgi:GTP-binding protein HflX